MSGYGNTPDLSSGTATALEVMMPGSVNWSQFADVWNDTGKYPTRAAVAKALGITERAVKDRAERYRKMVAEKPYELDDLVSRGVTAKTKDETSPEEHAQVRARTLSEDVQNLLTGTNYPVINPEAVIVESHMVRRYSRKEGYHLVEGPPRTWLSDTLRVEPVREPNGKTFIFTGAQNDADVHPIWENLVAYAKHIGAKLVVGPGTYETQWWSENNPASRSYAEELSDYLCFGEMKIGDNFVFCGEMNILPTASTPIGDLATYSRGRWGVFPAAKRQLKTVPSTDPNRQAHQVMTTGLCTKPKVIPRKAGIKAIFHQVAGAVIVEFDEDGDLFPRHLSAGADGSFYDLNYHVSGGKVRKAKKGESFIRYAMMPDVHDRKLGPLNAAALFGINIDTKKRMKCQNVIDDLNPQEILLEDLYDNETRNHHNKDDNAMFYELAYRGRDQVLDEIMSAGAFLAAIKRDGMKITVVESNHDLALERYVREGRYRKDGPNIRLGLQLEDAYLKYREDVAEALDAHMPTPKFSVLEYALKKKVRDDLDDVHWVYDGQSYIIDGVECGNHGFRGANGAKGTVTGFARLGRKMSIGDKHMPAIEEGVYVAGTSELQHGYNKGPSGWCVTLIVQYLDGKRALITLQNGKHRA